MRLSLGAAASCARAHLRLPAQPPLPLRRLHGGTAAAASTSSTSSTAAALAEPSYVCGPSSPALVYETLGVALSRAAAAWPERRALVSRAHDADWSWAELSSRVDRAAAGLLRAGVRVGDAVACWSLNRPEWVLTQLATARIGGVFVTLNPAYRAPEVAYALRACGASVLVTASAFKSSDYIAMLREIAPELARCAPGALRAAALPALRTVVQLGAAARGGAAPGMLAWEELCEGGVEPAAAATLAALARALQADDVCNVQFTSGTTGAPKGVQLSHHAILNNGRACGAAQRLGPSDAVCLPVPLYHCFGSVLGVLACLGSGAAMVFPGEGFDARATLAAVAAERCTALYGVPTMFVAALGDAHFARADLRSLRTGVISGAPVPIDLARAIAARMHMRELTLGYGMTETAPLSFMTRCDDELARRVASVGTAMPHVEAKVVDADGRVLPRGARGELCTRGYGVMRGYLGDAAATAAAVDAARWMHTGDLATIDAHGHCNIVGRIKDLVIRGGENIAPAEVEAVLRAHAAVLDAQVFGVDDEHYGEELVAWLVPRAGANAAALTADAIRAFCADKLAHFKVPRIVHVVEGFPLTTSGKPQKFLMRRAVEAQRGRAKPRTA